MSAHYWTGHWTNSSLPDEVPNVYITDCSDIRDDNIHVYYTSYTSSKLKSLLQEVINLPPLKLPLWVLEHKEELEQLGIKINGNIKPKPRISGVSTPSQSSFKYVMAYKLLQDLVLTPPIKIPFWIESNKEHLKHIGIVLPNEKEQ